MSKLNRQHQWLCLSGHRGCFLFGSRQTFSFSAHYALLGIVWGMNYCFHYATITIVQKWIWIAYITHQYQSIFIHLWMYYHNKRGSFIKRKFQIEYICFFVNLPYREALLLFKICGSLVLISEIGSWKFQIPFEHFWQQRCYLLSCTYF